MCWITLSPKKGHKYHHHHHGHHHDHDHDPSIEHLVRRDRVSFSEDVLIPTTLHPSHHHHKDTIRIVTPTLDHHHHHHGHHHHLHPHLHHRHHHHHMHPLHLHPITHKLHGHGKKRIPFPHHPPPPKPPPPSRCSSRPHSRSRSRDPIYRTQPISTPSERPYRTVIAEPGPRVEEVRETTRIALREARPERGRLRRVAGYEVLGREVPWNWDCVTESSVVGGGNGSREGRGRGRRKGSSSGSGLRFPPFGGPGSWM